MPSLHSTVRDRLRATVFRIYIYFGTAPARPHYAERASLLVVFATIFPAVIAYNDPNPRMRDWALLTIALPTGPVCYHIHTDDMWIFHTAGIPIVAEDDPRATWDGSTQDDHNLRWHALAHAIANRQFILGTRATRDPLDPDTSTDGGRPVRVISERPGVAGTHDTDIGLSNGLRIVVSHDAFVVSTTDGRRISFLDNVNIDETHECLDLELHRD